jgi:hypothetical protein
MPAVVVNSWSDYLSKARDSKESLGAAMNRLKSAWPGIKGGSDPNYRLVAGAKPIAGGKRSTRKKNKKRSKSKRGSRRRSSSRSHSADTSVASDTSDTSDTSHTHHASHSSSHTRVSEETIDRAADELHKKIHQSIKQFITACKKCPSCKGTMMLSVPCSETS